MQTPTGQALRPALLLVLALAALVVVSKTAPDVDLWGHVTFGTDIVDSGVIRQQDPYSFTADKEWINHEWLFEVAMAASYRRFGPAGLIALRWAFVAALCGLVWSNARRDGAARESALVLVAVVVLLTYPRTQHVRPQLASVVAFATALWVTRRASSGRTYYLAAVPPLMVLWANLHGGWLVGGGALGLWAAGQTVFGPSRRFGFLLGVATGVGLLATVANPYGVGLWQFLGSTVGFGRPDITEWGPITRVGWGLLTCWCITAVLAVRAMRRGVLPAPADRLLVLALAVASFRVSRLDTFFVIAAAMLCAGGGFVLGARAESASSAPLMRSRLGFALAASAALLLALLIPRRLGCIDMSDAWWLPEPAAVEYARGTQLHGRLLTYFDWGEYAIWHLAPGLKVSMDGRRETVYSMQQVDGHLKTYDNRPGGLDYVRSIAPDYAWLPRLSPMVPELRTQGWSVLWSGPRSTLLSRTGEPAVQAVASHEMGRRCFPGP